MTLPEETPPMPQSSDDTPSERVGEGPPGSRPRDVLEAEGSVIEPRAGEPRRRRRRRRGPRSPATAAGDAESLCEPTVPVGDVEPAGDARPRGGNSQSVPLPDVQPGMLSRRRRRRRRGPRPPSASARATASDIRDVTLEQPDQSSPASLSSTAPAPKIAKPDGGVGAGHNPEETRPLSEPGRKELPTGEPRMHLHRRRRHRRLPTETGAGEATAGGNAPIVESARGAGDVTHSAQSASGPSRNGEPRERSRHRRRRRAAREPSRADVTANPESQSGLGLGSDATPRAGSPANRALRIRGPRDRHRREGVGREEGPQQAGSRERRTRDGTPRDIGGTGGPRTDRRDQGSRAEGSQGTATRNKGRFAFRDGQQRPGRDLPKQRLEQKLYALESIVDRGFEDVVAEEADTRRIHWTIVKRTVADQKSGKPMSAVYVLQRDGVDTEFPNLGAARAAVNKSIVHPQKLTLSKAEHAAAKE